MRTAAAVDCCALVHSHTPSDTHIRSHTSAQHKNTYIHFACDVFIAFLCARAPRQSQRYVSSTEFRRSETLSVGALEHVCVCVRRTSKISCVCVCAVAKKPVIFTHDVPNVRWNTVSQIGLILVACLGHIEAAWIGLWMAEMKNAWNCSSWNDIVLYAFIECQFGNCLRLE